ncbi:hypothetical protein [uncultured Treponema sp.]|uniref:hypothetical protein n=1 Tax=uncultured Treponema sp. TaxID=162155 RepID=UPI0025D5D177|nr:hypothetical protein [uncultured Treponema sp.]
MKSCFRFSALLFSFTALPAFLLSCSNADQDAAPADETPTLRYTANSLYESTIWTEEIETDRLSTPVSSVFGISSKLNLSPLIVLAGTQPDSSRIFPTLSAFGSLDTTLISKSLRETLTSFSDCIAKNKDADSFFSKDSLYSLALFCSDFKRIFGDCFELDKIEENVKKEDSQTSEIKTATESKDSADAENPSSKNESEESENPSSENESEESEKPVPEKSYFSSFVFGQPFLDGIYYEVPVKFFSDKASLTLSVFCFENAGAWKIDQVQIDDWEIF